MNVGLVTEFFPKVYKVPSEGDMAALDKVNESQVNAKGLPCECQGLTTLMAVRVNDGLELEVTDPKNDQRDVEQEDGES